MYRLLKNHFVCVKVPQKEKRKCEIYENLLVSDLKDSTVKTKLNLYEQLFSPLPEKDLAFS